MTREEAKEYIQLWLKDQYGLNGKDREVLNMAIKALEQELCEDAISRKAVIDVIYDNKSDFKNDFAQGFFADRIRELPPVTVLGCGGVVASR